MDVNKAARHGDYSRKWKCRQDATCFDPHRRSNAGATWRNSETVVTRVFLQTRQMPLFSAIELDRRYI
jgi:hypothetical protein